MLIMLSWTSEDLKQRVEAITRVVGEVLQE